MWKLPYDSISSITALVSDTIPLFDELCRRVMNFIHTCLHCNSIFVRSVVAQGITSGPSSPIGRNALFCSLRFETHVGNVANDKITGKQCLKIVNSGLEPVDIDRAAALYTRSRLRSGRFVGIHSWRFWHS